MNENEIGDVIVAAAIHVHRELGPGLLESVYETVLAHELSERGLKAQRQVPVPIAYSGINFDQGFRADLLVEGRVIVELKSMSAINDFHRKQILTYLRMSGKKLGYLLNFGQSLMKKGITRVVNGLPEKN